MKKILFFMMLVFTMLIFAKESTQRINDTTIASNLKSDKYNPYNKKIISHKSNKENLSILDVPNKLPNNHDDNTTPAKTTAASKASSTTGYNKKQTINTDISNNINFSKLSQAHSNYQSTYTIQKGDTLGSISRKFSVAQGEIRQLNPYFNFSTLAVGAELIMPLSQDKINMTLKKQDNAEMDEAKEKKDEYKIISEPEGRKLRVIASAYTSHVAQSDSSPFEAAWGCRLCPGMKVIAVSRDLITQYRLTNGSIVKIGGLDGYYTVRDKMNKRYTKHIDIYMGLDKQKALHWGRRSVTIYW